MRKERKIKVGDLVKFANASWIGPVPMCYRGFGLIEEVYDDDTFEVYWPALAGGVISSRTLGIDALEAVNESR